MRALVVSDVHGNLQALQAVLSAAGSFDELWNLGDIVGYGANPNEVIDTIRPLARINVRGNHDRVCCGLTSSAGFNPVAAEAAAWTHRHLTPENLEWLRAVPQGPILASERALCAHGSPLNEDHYIISMRDAWSPLQRMSTEITFFGHTHVQGAFSQQAPEWQEIRPLYNSQNEPEEFSIDVPVGIAAPHQPRLRRPAARRRLARRLRPLRHRRRTRHLLSHSLRRRLRAAGHSQRAPARSASPPASAPGR